MEESGRVAIKDRAVDKDRTTKTKSKPRKSQSKTASNPDITRIDKEIAHFVVMRDSLSGESARILKGQIGRSKKIKC
jgi:hypothetical protein